MAFGVGTNAEEQDAGILRGIRIPIACSCWFTAEGKTRPLLFKFRDEAGEVHTVREITVHASQAQNFGGEPALRYDCTIDYERIQMPVRLMFFLKDQTWVMLVPEYQASEKSRKNV